MERVWQRRPSRRPWRAGAYVDGPASPLAREADARRPGRRPAESAQAVAHRLARRAALAARAASSGESPSASRAASVEECVQPEPCAAPSGWRSPGISTTSSPSKKTSVACVAVAAGDDDGARAERVDRARQLLAVERPPAASSARASGRFGVTTVARGRTRSTQRGLGAAVEQPRAGLGDHHRVDDDRRAAGPAGRAPRATASIVAAVAEHPDLHRVDADVARRRPGPGRRSSRAGPARRRRRATVFCAVIAVIAVMPCTPAARERLQVGLDAGAAAGVRAGDRQARAGSRGVGGHRRGGRIGRRSAARRARSARRGRARTRPSSSSSVERRRATAAASPGVARERVQRRRAAVDRAQQRPQARAVRPARGASRARGRQPARRDVRGSNEASSTSARVADDRARRRAAARSRPRASAEVTRPGHRADVAPEVERELGGDQRPRALGRLDDDRHAARAPAMIRLRAGKRQRHGGCPAAARRPPAPRAAIRSCSRALAARVGDVGAAGQHGDRAPAGLERARVRGGVDRRAPCR